MSKSRYRYRVAIEETIANAKGSRSLETVKAFDGATVYAYPQSQGRIAWSVNARENGLSILRGIRRPDGADGAWHSSPAARETSRLCALWQPMTPPKRTPNAGGNWLCSRWAEPGATIGSVGWSGWLWCGE